MRRKAFIAVTLLALSPSLAGAADPRPARMVIPVYSELVTLSAPQGFSSKFENAQGPHYIHELVPNGETVESWTEMVTISGYQGLSSKADLTPQIFTGGIAAGFQRACPNTFAATNVGITKVDGHDAFGAVISCGSIGSIEGDGKLHSESALIIVIKGTADYYTVQWADRGPASATAIGFDAPKWSDRARQLAPIGFCPVVPGEKAPYPSCTNRRP